MRPPAKTRMFPVVLSPFRRAAPPASRCKSANVTTKKLRIKKYDEYKSNVSASFKLIVFSINCSLCFVKIRPVR